MDKSSNTDFASDLVSAAKAALPVAMGYIVIGLPCGVMAEQAGFSWWQVLLLSATFYSGAGQFMTSSMVLAGAPLASIIASVGLVSSRQMLYAAAFAPYFKDVPRLPAAGFAAWVTDESFGVNLSKFDEGEWNVRRATIVNLISMASWAIPNAVGCAAGELIQVPVEVMSFAMTSIFICLLAGQKWDFSNVVVVVTAAVVVLLAKLVGLSGIAVFAGAVAGVAAGLLASRSGGDAS